MSYSVPAAFSNRQLKSGARGSVIVRLTTGDEYWFFSNSECELTADSYYNLSAETVLNGYLESWASSTNANDWTEAGTVTNDSPPSGPYQGSYSAKLGQHASVYSAISQIVDMNAGEAYLINAVGIHDTVTAGVLRLAIENGVGTDLAYFEFSTNDWTAKEMIYVADGSEATIRIYNTNINGVSYIDSISIKRIMNYGTPFHCYSLLESISGMASAVDIYSKQFINSDVTVSIRNELFWKTNAGVNKRVSDIIPAVVGKEARVYLLLGESVSDIDDCLLRFTGVVDSAPEYNGERVVLRFLDKSRGRNIILPRNPAAAVYSNVADKDKSLYIPLVYGTFSAGYNQATPFQTNGLARGIGLVPTNPPFPYLYIISDHPLNAVSNLLIDIRAGYPFIAESVSLSASNASYSNRGTGIMVEDANGDYFGNLFFNLNSSVPADYSLSGVAINPGNVYDDNETTYGTLRDNISDPGSGGNRQGEACFGIDAESVLHQILFSGIDPDLIIQTHDVALVSGVVDNQFWLRIYYRRYGSTNIRLESSDISLPIDVSGYSTLYTVASAGTALQRSNKPLAFSANFISSGGGDGLQNNQDLIRMYGFRFRLRKIMVKHDEYNTAIIQNVFFECQGRKFGTWIDASGWSNSHNSGDLIDKPNFIIASLLIDELGFSDSDLDKASFDDADGYTSQSMYVDLYRETTAFGFIESLLKQSTFAMAISGTGQARLIPLDNSNPTVSRTISYFHIRNESFKISKVPVYANQADYRSRYQEEISNYRDSGVANNTTSQGTYGTIKLNQPLDLRNISGSSVTNLLSHLISGTNGIWANEHILIEFEANGFIYADLDVGDWISLDSASFDPYLLAFGSSWSGMKFLIIEISQYPEKTFIRAIKLY